MRDGNSATYVIDANTNRYDCVGGSRPQYEAYLPHGDPKMYRTPLISRFKEPLSNLQNTLLRLPRSIAKILFMARCSLNKFRSLNSCRPCGEHVETTITQKSPSIWLS